MLLYCETWHDHFVGVKLIHALLVWSSKSCWPKHCFTLHNLCSNSIIYFMFSPRWCTMRLTTISMVQIYRVACMNKRVSVCRFVCKCAFTHRNVPRMKLLITSVVTKMQIQFFSFILFFFLSWSLDYKHCQHFVKHCHHHIHTRREREKKKKTAPSGACLFSVSRAATFPAVVEFPARWNASSMYTGKF